MASASRNRAGRRPDLFIWLKLRCFRNYGDAMTRCLKTGGERHTRGPGTRKETVMTTDIRDLPVAVVGAGPVGLAVAAHLIERGWQEPPADTFPTGGDLYDAYLKPLAATPEMAAVIETGTTVEAITRQGLDKVSGNGRET